MTTESAKHLINHYSSGAGTSSDLRNSALIELVLSKIKGKKIIDVGCGSGYLLSKIKRHESEVFGIEPNHDLAMLLKKNYPDIPVIEEGVEKLRNISFLSKTTNSPIDKFDTITILDVVEHLEDDTKALQIIHEKLLMDGQLILVVPAHKILYGKRDISMGHYRRYNKKDLILKLKKTGFVIEETRHWNMIAFIPYLFTEKILKKELNLTNLRTSNNKEKRIKTLLRKIISWWLFYIENKLNFGFGLSMIVIAKKIKEP